MFPQLLISGFSMGCIYAMLAIGFTMIWNTATVVNFAHGEFAMMGMFFLYTFNQMLGLPLVVSLLLAVVITAILGILMELLIKPVFNSDPHSVLIITMGVSTVFTNGVRLIWGTHPLYMPSFLGNEPIYLGNVKTTSETLWNIAIIGVLIALLTYFSLKTRTGKSLRAIAQNRNTAWLMGINVNRSIALTFALSTALAALCGTLLAPIFYVTSDMGLSLVLKSFSAAVIGGFGSYPGALIGGIFIGILDNLSAFYISNDYRDVILYGFLIFMLYFYPQGLFGKPDSIKP